MIGGEQTDSRIDPSPPRAPFPPLTLISPLTLTCPWDSTRTNPPAPPAPPPAPGKHAIDGHITLGPQNHELVAFNPNGHPFRHGDPAKTEHAADGGITVVALHDDSLALPPGIARVYQHVLGRVEIPQRTVVGRPVVQY